MASQGKKKNRGKNAEPDPDDVDSELSVTFDDNGPAAATKKKGKKGKKGLSVDDDEYDVSALDGNKPELSANIGDNGVAPKKKGKKGKKGLPVDDDEYDVSTVDDDKSVQSIESAPSRDGSKRGKKGKQATRGRDDDDDDELLDNLERSVVNLTAPKKGKKAAGAGKPKANAGFALLDEMDGSGDLAEDESDVDEDEVELAEQASINGMLNAKPGKKDANISATEEIGSISSEVDDDSDALVSTGKKKAKGRKGKSDNTGVAALDTSDETADHSIEDPEVEETLVFSGKKKQSKNKIPKESVDSEVGRVEAREVELVDDVALDEDALVFSGKKKSKAKKGIKSTEGSLNLGFAMLDDQADESNAAIELAEDVADEDALVFTGKKKSKKSKDSKKVEDSEYGLVSDVPNEHALDSEDVITFSGKKKSKGKQGATAVGNDDAEDASLLGAGASVTAQSGSSSLQSNDTRQSSVLADEEEIQFTGKKKGKKGKKVTDDADIDAILAELDGSKVPEDPKAASKAQEDSNVVPVDANAESAKNEDLGAASKKKAKKGKKSGRTAQEEEDLDAILAELDGPRPEKQPTSGITVEQVQEAPPQESSQPAPEGGEEVEGVESAAAKKKKKKKEKEKAKAAGKQSDQVDTPVTEEKQEAPKSKVPDKKVPKHVREMQERLAKQKETEERLRREEEEKRRKEEEELRRLEELEREKEEAKRRKKEREKEKLLKKKQEGKLLTGKQKEEAKRLALMREQLLAQKGMDLDSSSKEESVPKKPKYDNKKKRRPQGGESGASTEPPPEEAEAPLPQEMPVESDAVEKEPEVVPDVVPIEEEGVGEAQAEVEVEEDDEDWDAKSWDADDIELPPVKSAFAEEEEDEVSAPKKGKPVVSQAPEDVSLGKRSASPPKPASRPTTTKQESEEDSESEDETDSEEDDSTAKRRREAANKRATRKAEALANRSADDLRSPICCILGHVDTGKTKLLDCIRRTNVQEGEAGGITQQIGATYFPRVNILERTKDVKTQVTMRVPGLLVIDTPGHESFTNLRSRGSGLCDIAILVVDIMHGMEPQTLESLNLLRMRHTPFVVALNKVDRLYSWKTCANSPINDAFDRQSKDVMNEFERRLSEIVTQLKEQGLNSELYYKNPDRRKYVSIVPTSAISGEGVPDLLMLLITLTQQMMESKLMYISEVQCTVLEVKVVEGLGTTIDVILVNGVLHEGDQIVVCGMQGPIVTSIRALLTPHPMKEIRVKGQYLHHKELKAAQGIKITAQGLEHAIAGTQLHVVGPDDDLEDVKEEAMEDMKNVMSRVDKSGEGVCVQASTLGSLEALLEFLKSPAVKIPVSGINIGPVHKRDVMRASVMLERKKKEYATILAFDVKVTPEAKELAEELGVRIFTADIIYHLFDQFTAYMNNIREEKRKEVAEEAVFPCVLRIKPEFVFNKKDPIILGVDVTEGIARVGTPICVPSQEMIDIGRIASMEVNHKVVDTAKKGQAVAMKIAGSTPEEIQKMYGRHFDHQDELVSHITRRSIDVLKESFRDELSVDEWKLVVKLKKLFNIP
ncbi:hypothetical protein GOP47_0005194 [Adiantum capillus-veneris]|uniref:Eukaryotic translation initiation factor 5B n=1 Tax=Adiantum capillus-veneris TaxID=13818 RepID=A0A9D4V597_ADICA|nr:hypothetical protein GOP47_0005194 [Adiantum capillus-veneris]